MTFAELSAARYSLRKFASTPVEQEMLDIILEAGRNAPTAHNNQPQRIFVIRTPEALEKAARLKSKQQKRSHLRLQTLYR